jgi:hypothetical protein
MRFLRCLGIAICVQATTAVAQVPVAQLASPPADARQFSIVSSAGKLGAISTWTAPDGTLMARMSLNLRGQMWEQDEATKLGADGAISDYRLRGFSPSGDIGETFSIANGIAKWKSPFDAGSAPYVSPAFYFPAGWSLKAGDLLIEWMTAHLGRELALLPGGKAHLEKLTKDYAKTLISRSILLPFAIMACRSRKRRTPPAPARRTHKMEQRLFVDETLSHCG